MPTVRRTSAALLLALAAVSSVSAPALAGPVLDPQFTREGTGQRRDALTARELTPFDPALWGTLSNWSGGEPLSAANTSGKVVLIYTWSTWYPQAMRSAAMIQKLHAAHAKDGLVIVGAHHQDLDKDGWPAVVKAAADSRLSFLIAHDATGAFRKALDVDQDPDFYLIDRAGQLRYADIATSAVEAATAALVKETAEQAGSLNKGIEQARVKAAEEAARTGEIRGNVALRDLPEIPFAQPDPGAYAAAQWPRPPRRDENSGSSWNQPQGPVSVRLPAGPFFPEAAPATTGRVVVLYFWSPLVRASWGPIPQLDRLARELGRDGVVVGVMNMSQPDNFGGQQNANAENSPDRLMQRLTRFAQEQRLSHPLLADPAGALLRTITGSETESMQFRVDVVGDANRAAVISSDGVMRWSGRVSDPGFRAAIDQVLRVDPGIKARREAETAYIRGGGK